MGHLVKMNFEHMAELDKGRLGAVLQRQIQIVQQDCINRPIDASGKSQPRKILVEFDFTPTTRTGDLGVVDLEDVVCEVTIKNKLPAYKSNPIRMVAGKDGFFFNPDFPNDPNQTSLPFSGDDDA